MRCAGSLTITSTCGTDAVTEPKISRTPADDARPEQDRRSPWPHDPDCAWDGTVYITRTNRCTCIEEPVDGWQ